MRRLTLPLVLLALLAIPACSSGGVTGDCQRICATVMGCYGQPSLTDACTSTCLERAGGADAGPTAQAVVRGCADCVGAQSCLGLAGGACNASCPSAGVNLPTTPSPAPSATTCTHQVPLDAQTGTVSCRRTSSDWSCDCYVDGVESEWFASIDFCTASDATRAQEAVKGCRW